MNKFSSSWLSGLCSLLAVIIFQCACPVIAGAETPLPQEGKKTVFQRVVSHPGASLFAGPDASAQVLRKPRTFTAFYVYERQGEMLKVGASSTRSEGWIKASDCTNWPQAITMVFTDPMGRQPVLFFKNHGEMEKACSMDNINQYLDQYIQLFQSKSRIPDDCPVIAIEPSGQDGSVSQSNFYLLPVTNIDTQFKESGTQLLEVACLNPGIPGGEDGKGGSGGKSGVNGKPGKQQGKSGKPGGSDKPDAGLSTGIAIVIDTTISMKPYIDETLKVVRNIYDKLSKSGVADQVGIAVVAFRSNTSKSPGVEYTTKVISDFKHINDRRELERLLSQVDEAKAATHAFDEDSIAGVMEAADSLSWDQFNSKIMLLITDAGPLGAGDSTSKTGMSPEAMADYLRTNNIFLTTFHIRTPAGKKDHSYAEKSYRALSLLSNNQSSYIPVEAKTPKETVASFARASETLATTYLEIVENESRNELVKPEMKEPSKKSTPEEKARYIAEITGYAMRLQFAGNRKGTEAPSVVSAWISDSDLAGIEKNPDSAPVPAVYPAVLLTKSQLSQLRKQLKTIIQTAEEAFFRDNENFNFYEQLISAAAQMSRDPSQFNQSPEANLAQRGVLLEVLDGLPYKSRILGMRQDDWTNMSTGEQQDFIRRLKGLVRRYEEYDRDNEHWEGFGESNPNEWVYRVPLNVLP